MTGDVSKSKKKIVSIPVCYEAEYGPDLSFVAEHTTRNLKSHVLKSCFWNCSSFSCGDRYHTTFLFFPTQCEKESHLFEELSMFIPPSF